MTVAPDLFPRTPHLAWLGAGHQRDDKILSDLEQDALLSAEVLVEEKIDGANLALSAGSDGRMQARNRATVLGRGAHPQFDPLWPWLAQRERSLVEALESELTLYGEWCFAVHSVRYDALPNWFLGFDVHDRRTDRFWSTARRDVLLRRLAIPPVPTIARGRFTLDALLSLLEDSTSRVGSGPIEGLYLRREQDDWLLDRAKLVRAEFVESLDEHWMRRPLQRNRLATSAPHGAEASTRITG